MGDVRPSPLSEVRLSRLRDVRQSLPHDVRHPANPDTPSGVRPVVSVPDITTPSATFLVDVLERAEASRSTELVAFETPSLDRIGELLFSHGEVCLVALSQGQVSLGSRLARLHPDTATVVRRAVAAARAEGRPLSDALAELEGADSQRIREALLDQIAEGLCELGRAAPDGLFESSLSASTRHLSSVLAGFPPAAVYWRAMPLLLPPVEDAAAACHRELAPGAGISVLLARTEEGCLPIVASGLPPGRVADIVALGRQIHQIADPPALLAADVRPSVVMLSVAGDAVLVVSTTRQIAMLGDLGQGGRQRALGVAHRTVAAAQ